MAKTDIQRAQKIIRKAMVKAVRECGLDTRWDLFVPIALYAVSAVFTEACSFGSTLHEPNGVGKLADFGASEFRKMLAEDLAGRLEHERKQTRQ